MTPGDKTTLDPSQPIFNGMEFAVIQVHSETRIETESIPFATTQESDPESFKGTQRVKTTGVPGERELTYIDTYEDGIVVTSELLSEEIVIDPIDQVVLVGTKVRPIITGGPASCGHWDSVIDSKTSDEKERTWLKHVMRCESGCNPSIVSYNGLWHGLFQYRQDTFASHGGRNIYDGNEQIQMTLAVLRGLKNNPAALRGQWTCSIDPANL